jgi:6-phosphofructokinase 1
MEVIGIEDGFDGAIHNRTASSVLMTSPGFITLGGTILGTSNTAKPYRYAFAKTVTWNSRMSLRSQ